MNDDGIWLWFVVFALIIVVPIGWHSKLRYALQYGVDLSQVAKDAEPHDCEFLSAPLGDKHCDYKPVVDPQINDNGRVVSVYVSWEKVDN